MIKEITSFIADRSGLVLGTTIQHGVFLPENPDRCVLVAFNRGGVVDFELPDRADVIVQCLARAPKYSDAYDDAWLIYGSIHGQSEWALPVLVSGNAYRVHTITAMTYPQYIGPDEKGRYFWTCNYIFRVANAAY